MQRVLVTGSQGFVGRNLMLALSERDDVEAVGVDIDSSDDELSAALKSADLLYHLAGVNRPKETSEFEQGNHKLTASVLERLITFDLDDE